MAPDLYEWKIAKFGGSHLRCNPPAGAGLGAGLRGRGGLPKCAGRHGPEPLSPPSYGWLRHRRRTARRRHAVERCMKPIDEQHIAEPGLVVPDITGGDEDTVRAVAAALEERWATSGYRLGAQRSRRARCPGAGLRRRPAPGTREPVAESLGKPPLTGWLARRAPRSAVAVEEAAPGRSGACSSSSSGGTAASSRRSCGCAAGCWTVGDPTYATGERASP
ncbi:DUF6207 family protein [Streptomyces sp. NPDC059917]|uniref:DUF6207 family protein n=1 Tax=Streptomyces sp. NPDC059917 TaxID=3347002 RepID=UPI00365835E1